LPFRFLGRPVDMTDGTTIGKVEEVRLYGAQFTLVLPFEGRQVLIPAVPPILRPDDALDGPLVIDPPEGLLDVAGD
jgi:16S rRNA processing protein RimM